MLGRWTLVLLLLLAPMATAQEATLEETLVLYGPEGWKDEPALGPVGGVGGDLPTAGGDTAATGVTQNPYAGGVPHQGGDAWLGSRLEAVLQARTEDGEAMTETGLALTAEARLTGGPAVPVKVQKEGPGLFRLVVDLDGEAGSDTVPPVLGSALQIDTTLTRTPDPLTGAITLSRDTFRFSTVVGGLGLPVSPLAEEALLGYADVGRGDQAHVTLFQAESSATLDIPVHFGRVNGTATIHGYHRGTGGVVAETELINGRGEVRVDLGDVVASQGLGLVAATVVAEGPEPVLGAGQTVIPIGTTSTSLVGFQYQGIAPDDALGQLLVTVADPAAPTGPEAPTRGEVFLISGTGEVLSSAPYPPASFAPTLQERTALVPVGDAGNETRYLVVSVLQASDGSVYSLSQARRGLSVRAQPASTDVGEPGTLLVLVENLNDNFDDQRTPNLDMTVNVTFHDVPGQGTVSLTETIPEGEVHPINITVASAVEGAFPVTVEVSADEFLVTNSATFFVGRTPGSDNLNLLPLPWPLLAIGFVLAGRWARRLEA